MILAFIFSFFAHAQTDAQVGQYFHARAEAELVHYLENHDLSMGTVLSQDEKLTCVNLDDFAATLDEVKQKAREVLIDLNNNGVVWRTPSNYGEINKVAIAPKMMMGYLSERLRFTKLEAFSRLAKMSLGCMDVFRTDPAVARNIQEIPRFRLDSINNVTPVLFCTVAVRYWKEVSNKMPSNCRRAEE